MNNINLNRYFLFLTLTSVNKPIIYIIFIRAHTFYFLIFYYLFFYFSIFWGLGPAQPVWAGLSPASPAWSLAQASDQLGR